MYHFFYVLSWSRTLNKLPGSEVVFMQQRRQQLSAAPCWPLLHFPVLHSSSSRHWNTPVFSDDVTNQCHTVAKEMLNPF